jgi:hypothetical protein
MWLITAVPSENTEQRKLAAKRVGRAGGIGFRLQKGLSFLNCKLKLLKACAPSAAWRNRPGSRGPVEQTLVHRPARAGVISRAVAPGVQALPWQEFVSQGVV